ncbi:MAG TPA: mechanosensitive ion channel domain-containing protein [Nitrososphaeraceae archaeon]|nr:mechanosensitive ion channel domain-containing protein [Nitrososphaeraceae archaeon]
MDPNNEKNSSIDDNIINNIDSNNALSSEKNLKAKQTKSKFIKRIVVLGIIFTIAFVTIEYFLEPRISKNYLMLLQSIQVSIVGYFVIEVISNAFHDLTYDYLKDTSKSIKILMRILGSIVIIAIIISYLSNDPIVAASIGTISGLVVGFASQNIIGNIIAGLYLAILRPFKLGDEITAFNNTGVIFDIGLITTKLYTSDNKIVLVPNSSMVTTTIVLNKRQ